MTSVRLLRHASFRSNFNYSIKFKKGCDNANVDCLSYAPLVLSGHTLNTNFSEKVNQIYATTLFQIIDNITNAKLIAAESQKNPIQVPLIQSLQK